MSRIRTFEIYTRNSIRRRTKLFHKAGLKEENGDGEVEEEDLPLAGRNSDEKASLGAEEVNHPEVVGEKPSRELTEKGGERREAEHAKNSGGETEGHGNRDSGEDKEVGEEGDERK